MLAASLIGLLTLAAYADSFTGPFIFDGEVRIELNSAPRTLWPPWAPMIGTRRPIGDWSFAANYALSGLHTWGYHVVNLAIHLAAALALFGVVRRSLASRRLASALLNLGLQLGYGRRPAVGGPSSANPKRHLHLSALTSR